MRPNLVFDLDNTLISALDREEQKSAGDLSSFETHDMDGEFLVVSRPGLQEFLDWVFSKFRVSVFTAASPHYGAFIVDNILLQGKPERKREFFAYLSRPHFEESKRRFGVPKSLRLLYETYKLPGFSKDNTVLLDDLQDAAKEQNWCQVITASYFVATDEKAKSDSFLLEEAVPLLKKYLRVHKEGSHGKCLLQNVK